MVVDVLEPGVLLPLDAAAVLDDPEGLSELLTGGVEKLTPAVEGAAFRDGAVIGGDLDGVVEVLNPSAWFETAEDLGVESWPVLDGPHEAADVDKVKIVVGEGPKRLGVVELEAAVCGNPDGLDGGEVGADDFSRGELVGEVYCPNSRAGSDVNDFLGRVPYRSEEELIIEGEEKHLMAEVQAFVLDIIVGTPISSVRIEVLVSSTVQLAVLTDALGQGQSCTCIIAECRIIVVSPVGILIKSQVSARGPGGWVWLRASCSAPVAGLLGDDSIIVLPIRPPQSLTASGRPAAQQHL